MSFQPKMYQPQWDWQAHIQPLADLPGGTEETELDVLFVGGGPAGLSGAIRLKQLCQKEIPDIQIGVLEKASRIGGHCLSGAVIDPIAFKKLFPNLKEEQWPFRQKIKKEKLFYLSSKKHFPLPLPPTMKNKNFYTASLCEILRWMEKEALNLDINIFNSFTAGKFLTDKNKIKGVLTMPSGLNKDGNRSSSYQEAFALRCKILVLADGSRGHLSQTFLRWKNISSKYPQTYALGVKELWEVSQPLENEVWHSMGWPLPASCFGGAWLYGMGKNLVSIGLVAGLDSPFKDLDVHLKLQQLKQHPLFAKILKGGKCLEWGAKTIPEGGFYSLPDKLYEDHLLIAGDAGGMVNVPALKGIHYAMTAGRLSAETAFKALKAENFSAEILKTYDKQVKKESCIGKELYPVRNVRQAFDKNIFLGLLKSGLMFLTKGFFPGDSKKKSLSAEKILSADAEKIKTLKTDQLKQDEKIKTLKTAQLKQNEKIKTLSKTSAVYLSGNKTRDNIPLHLKAKENLPEEVKKFYEHLCPAGVYENKEGKWIINAPNCIDCKATDVLGPIWNPKEGGAGPDYRQM